MPVDFLEEEREAQWRAGRSGSTSTNGSLHERLGGVDRPTEGTRSGLGFHLLSPRSFFIHMLFIIIIIDMHTTQPPAQAAQPVMAPRPGPTISEISAADDVDDAMPGPLLTRDAVDDVIGPKRQSTERRGKGVFSNFRFGRSSSRRSADYYFNDNQ